MPCSFHCEGQFDRGLINGVSRAIEAFGSIPGALSIARSGGNEQTVGRLLLGAIEEETRCFAFAEEPPANGPVQRNDYAMRCVNCPEDDRVLAVLELKHNMAHREQLSSIRKEKGIARKKLVGLHEGNISRSYYHIHFIFGLRHDDDSPLANFHNHTVNTRYKHFLPRNELDAVMHQITGIDMLGPSTRESEELKHPADNLVSAWLHCWVFKLRDGTFELMKIIQPESATTLLPSQTTAPLIRSL